MNNSTIMILMHKINQNISPDMFYTNKDYNNIAFIIDNNLTQDSIIYFIKMIIIDNKYIKYSINGLSYHNIINHIIVNDNDKYFKTFDGHMNTGTIFQIYEKANLKLPDINPIFRSSNHNNIIISAKYIRNDYIPQDLVIYDKNNNRYIMEQFSHNSGYNVDHITSFYIVDNDLNLITEDQFIQYFNNK